MDEPDEYIDFMAKYRDWISMKRLGIRPTTKPEEIVYHLAGIRSTIDSKSYPFLEIRTQVLDEYAASVCAGMRKSYGSLSAVMSKLDGAATKKAISESCSKELAPIAEIYLLNKVISSLGFDISINQTVMSKIYKELKPPRTPGRKKGK